MFVFLPTEFNANVRFTHVICRDVNLAEYVFNSWVVSVFNEILIIKDKELLDDILKHLKNKKEGNKINNKEYNEARITKVIKLIRKYLRDNSYSKGSGTRILTNTT
jgi:hypothetical protein